MLRHLSLLLLIFLCSPAAALDELIDSTWLNANIHLRDLILLDIREPTLYRYYHIPGAVNAPYDRWRTGKESKKPGMLPPTPQMETLLSELRIDNNSTVVIVTGGNQPGDMAAAGRVFWTLKVMGHRKVAVLNGGLADYTTHFARDAETASLSRPISRYRPNPDFSVVATHHDILVALQDDTQLLDARTLGEYTGVVTANPLERPGTIPGAKHLPFDWLVDAHGRIRDKEAVITLYQAVGLNPNQDGTIHFCHTGNRAALTWFVDYVILGNRKARLYDASMSEWAAEKTLPIETMIDLDPKRQ